MAIDAGIVSAYGFAVAHGYTGTPEQFGEDQANFAANAQQVREDKKDVEELIESIPPDYTTMVEAVDDITEATSQNGNFIISPGTGTSSVILNEISGSNANVASGDNSLAEGLKATALGDYAHAEGHYTHAEGENSHAEGMGGQYTSNNATYISGAKNKADHSEGYQTIADSGSGSTHYGAHAEGYQTQAIANAAHSEGYKTKASGAYSHAEGSSNTASNFCAHAEGSGTIASGSISHAEGDQTISSAQGSHAEGGYHTTASGTYSHAEGNGSVASGDSAHAEGVVSTASGRGAHAEGLGTIANHAFQHVVGAYNIEDPSENISENPGTYLEIVGNGTHSQGVTTRSNARTLDWDGNEVLAGNLTAAGGSITVGQTTFTENQLSAVNEVEDLKSSIADVNDYALNAYATDTASGAIATFPDGADGIPIKSLSVAIEPVQDLHGYDNPWPAGGGTNIFDPYSYFINRTASGLTSEIMSDGTIHISGTATAENRYGTSTRFDFPAGTFIVVGKPQQVIVRDANGIISNNGVFTVDGDTPIYFSVKVTNGETYDFYEKIQLNTGSDAIDWTPYSNICPISGHTECNVVRTGKNLLRYPYSEGSATVRGITYTPQSDGSILINGTATGGTSAYSVYKSASPLYIPNGNYVFTTEYEGTISNNAIVRLVTKIGGANTDLSFGDSANVTIDNGVLYLSFRFPTAAVATDAIVRPMLRLASISDATWEAYKGITYPITFPSGTGTVYGGNITVNQDGSGELVVTHKAVDLGTFTWGYNSTNNYGYVNVPSKAFGNRNVITTAYKTSNANTTSGMQNGEIKGNASNSAIYVKDARFTSADEYQAGLDGVIAVYELATPVNIPLTAPQITTLLGHNNMWSDTGDVSVIYRANTAMFIQKKIAEALNA